MSELSYKNYSGTVEYSKDDKCLYALAVMFSKMNDEITLIENNYERLKIKRDTIKEILIENRKK